MTFAQKSPEAGSCTRNDMGSISINFGELQTPYHFGYNCFDSLADLIADTSTDSAGLIIVADEAMGSFAQALSGRLSRNFKTLVLKIRATERSKTLSYVEELMTRVVISGIGRRATVIAIGGGLVGNLAGTLAAFLFRGIPLIHVPTTPIAAFDSVLSLKQAVNLSVGKNLVGSYTAPRLIAADLSLMHTIPLEELHAGLVEMAKNVLAVCPELSDKFILGIESLDASDGLGLFQMLEIGVTAKAPFLRSDPKEQAEALIFEYGHTIGHAIEFQSEGRLSHGSSVAWGMHAAAQISGKVLGLPLDAMEQHLRLLGLLGFSPESSPKPNLAAVSRGLFFDNKRGYTSPGGSEVPMVLLRDLGVPALEGEIPLVSVDIDTIDRTLNELFYK